ncbi:unnamed protein product [Rotaria socialis]
MAIKSVIWIEQGFVENGRGLRAMPHRQISYSSNIIFVKQALHMASGIYQYIFFCSSKRTKHIFPSLENIICITQGVVLF